MFKEIIKESILEKESIKDTSAIDKNILYLHKLGFTGISNNLQKISKTEKNKKDIPYPMISQDMINKFLRNKEIKNIVLTLSFVFTGILTVCELIALKIVSDNGLGWTLSLISIFPAIFLTAFFCSVFCKNYTWEETALDIYKSIPPASVLVSLEKAISKNIFENFTIATIQEVKKDPLLLGYIHGERYFIAQWDNDISLKELLNAK